MEKVKYDIEADCYYFDGDKQITPVFATVQLYDGDGKNIGNVDLNKDGSVFGVEIFGWHARRLADDPENKIGG